MAALLAGVSSAKLLQARQLHQSVGDLARSVRNLSPNVGDLSTIRKVSQSAPLRTPMGLIEDLEPEKKKKNPKKARGAEFMRRLEKAVRGEALRETLDKLVKGVVYVEPAGLVAVNKPYGLPVNQAEDSPVSLTACLPGLATRLGTDSLEVVKSCDRYCSGIAILSSKPQETREKLKMAKQRGWAERELMSSYLAVATGHSNLHTTDNFVLRLAECRHIKNPVISKVHKEPVIHRHLTVPWWKRKEKNEKTCHLYAETLARSSRAPLSLLTLHPTSVKNHLLCVWLADRGHPLLGDGMYDYRVKTIMGRQVVSGPQFTQVNRVQILPPATLDLFGLERGEEWRLPKFLHNWRLHLPGWLPKGEPLTLLAPPPQHFLQALEFMEINFDYSRLEEDPIHVFQPRDKPKKKKAKDSEIKEITSATAEKS